MSENQRVNIVFEKVSFVNKISTILKATSDDDKPIPGYLYHEISKITHESDGYCESTLEYLVDRLEKDSCHVKLKVLKMMKYLIENGHRNFRFGLLKNSRGITAAIKFSGPPDPLHGNVPYNMVRKTAKELSELLFDTESFDARQDQEEKSPPKRGDIVGLGPSSSHSGKFEGFGNSPARQKKTFGDTVIENVYKMAEKMGEKPADQQRELLKSVQSVGGYKPPSAYLDDPSPVLPISMPEVKPKRVEPVRKHVPGKAGGGWEDEDEDYNGYRGNSQTSEKRSSDSNDLLDRTDRIPLEDWSGEEHLVASTVENGDTFLLKRQEIKEFLKSCHQLSCYKILELLNQKLRSGINNCVMRSLLLVENFLMTDLLGIDQLVGTCKDNLIWLVHKYTGPIASKALKIIRILEKLSNTPLLDRSVTCRTPPTASLDSGQDSHKQLITLQNDSTEQQVVNNEQELILHQSCS